MKDYTTALKELDKGNFCSMSFHKSYDARLCKQGLVRILEIQAENGQYRPVIWQFQELLLHHHFLNI